MMFNSGDTAWILVSSALVIRKKRWDWISQSMAKESMEGCYDEENRSYYQGRKTGGRQNSS